MILYSKKLKHRINYRAAMKRCFLKRAEEAKKLSGGEVDAAEPDAKRMRREVAHQVEEEHEDGSME